MGSYFPKDSVIRKVNNDPAIAFMAGRALMLQLAHPAVGQGVQDHSNFKRNPFKRLQGTLEAMYSIVNGSEELALGIGRRIHWIHTFVVGPNYQANIAENLLWVHATLMDSALLGYQTFVGPLSADDQETYYQEMKRVARPFGLSYDDQPSTLSDFNTYFADAVESLKVTDVSQELIGYIIRPTLPLKLHVPFAPALALHRVMTMGFTPPSLREQLGWEWGAKQEKRFERWRGVLKAGIKVQPRPVRHAQVWLGGRPLLWQAKRHVRQFEAKQQAAAATTPNSG